MKDETVLAILKADYFRRSAELRRLADASAAHCKNLYSLYNYSVVSDPAQIREYADLLDFWAELQP